MHTIDARDADDALTQGIRYLNIRGLRGSSRNGAVVYAPGAVTTTYAKPAKRVIFRASRNANPFFHLFEALWMLAGRNDVAWVSQFNRRMKEYSDDGKAFHSAYGHRWRSAFKVDQLNEVVELLHRDPSSRRAVIQMWDADRDLAHDGNDLPCNTHIYVDLRDRTSLNMTVCCRSNDALWGAYGANVVHFSILQEYLAGLLGAEIGWYSQVSHNLHYYPEALRGGTLSDILYESAPERYNFAADPNPVFSFPMFSHRVVSERIAENVAFHKDLLMLFVPEWAKYTPGNLFMERIVWPMRRAWELRQDVARAVQALAGDALTQRADWVVSARDWLERRAIKQQQTGRGVRDAGN